MKYLIFLVLSLTSQESLKKNITKSYYEGAPKLFEVKKNKLNKYIRTPTPWKEYKRAD